MKHAFDRSRILAFALAALFIASTARAETVEARAAVMLRDHAAANGRVVDRLAAGARLTLVEMSGDGTWARVRTKSGREGWVPVASVRSQGGEPPAPAADDDSLAKRRNVRPEAWVSKSKYHEEDNKMTVTAAKAELYGRPQATGTVLGIVRRGEVVQFVRKSSDKKWVQIDIGAGELAWVDARAVRMGADMDRADTPPDEPRHDERRADRRDEPPPSPPSSRRRNDEPSPDEVRRSERSRDDEAPPTKRDDRAAADERRRRDEDERRRRDEDDRRRRDERAAEEEHRRRDDHTADDDRRRRDERSADDDRRRRDERAADDRRRQDERDDARRHRDDEPKPARENLPHGANYFDLRVRLGFATVGERVLTNSTSSTLLRNYEHGTTNLAIGIQLGYSRAIGKLRLHIDGKYLLAAAGSVLYKTSDTMGVQLAILDQNIGGGVAVGGFFDVAGGIDLRLRLGGEAWINQIGPSLAPLQIASDIVLGMTIGIEFAMPAVVYIVDRPLGFRLKGGALAPATRNQQPNIKTTPNNTTLGGYVGFALDYGVLERPKRGQLHVELGYDFSFAFSHFTGACPATTGATRICRDDTVDDANYSSSAHVGTIGIYYQY